MGEDPHARRGPLGQETPGLQPLWDEPGKMGPPKPGANPGPNPGLARPLHALPLEIVCALPLLPESGCAKRQLNSSVFKRKNRSPQE